MNLESKSSTYITTLTPLRGIAALLITIYHCNFGVKPFLLDYTKFLQNAAMWVDFFFVLSGFIMCYVYHSYFSIGVTWSKYKKFIGARFARVYPLHFFTTLWAFLCSVLILHYATSIDPASIGEYNLKALPACLFLLNGFPIFSTFPLNVPSWSLSVEWWMYMVFPFIAPLLLTLKVKGKLWSLMAVLIFYCTVVFYGPPIDSYNKWLFDHLGFMIPYIPISKCFGGFLLGMLMYTFFERKSGYSLIKSDWFFTASMLAAVLAMHFGLTAIVIIACFSFIILSAAYNTGRVKRIFDTPVMQKLGNWSFSIYLVHYPVIYMYFILRLKNDPTYLAQSIFLKEQNYTEGFILCAIIVTITLFISALSWRFLEMPSRNFLNKAFNRNYSN